MKWHFSPPFAPQANGLAEVFVKLGKEQFEKTAKTTCLQLPAFQALLKKAQVSINDRPIGLATLAGHEQVLTPNHFIFGRSTAPLVNPEAEDNLYLVRQFQEVQKIHDKFKNAWHQQILCHIHSRKKWQLFRKNLKVGQLVVMAIETQKRWTWPLAKVTQLRQDKNGVVREVVVTTQRCGENKVAEYRRSVRQIVPLDIFVETGTPHTQSGGKND